MSMNMDENAHKTGAFPGHAISAAFFLFFGCSVLGFMLKRSMDLPPGRTYCQLYVPETNAILLRQIGWTVIVATSIGILGEGLGAVFDSTMPEAGFFHQLTHETLYLSFGFVGVIALLESKRKVPPDTCRAGMVLALVLNYVMMNAHGNMKRNPTDSIVHIYLAQLHLVNALVMAYSIKYPDSLIAYVTAFGLIVITGLWMLTLGFYACCIDISMHEAGTYFSLEIVLVFFAIVGIGAYCLPPEQHYPDNNNSMIEREYGQLTTVVDGSDQMDDDEEMLKNVQAI